MNGDSPVDCANESINLAAASDFRLGSLQVRPSFRRIEQAGGEAVELEPRVMQVLVALHRADGAVISRDRLIELCWGGRVVGDDALNRCIVALRRIARQLADPALRIETVPRVGYRLAEDAAEPSPPTPADRSTGKPSKFDRRFVLAGTATLAVGLAGGAWWRLGSPELPLEAVALYRRASEARGSASAEQTEQAVAYLREATRIAPDYADAWAMLALGYRSMALSDMQSDGAALEARARSAVRRALELDPDNRNAQAALALMQPGYRNWAKVEADCRRLLRRDEGNEMLLNRLGGVLADVGRWNDAAETLQRALAVNRLMAGTHYLLIVALWSAARLDDAEKALDTAAALWPKHSAIWATKVKFLTFTGRPAAAAALVDDLSARPTDYPQAGEESVRATIRAAATRNPEDIERAVKLEIQHVGRHFGNAAVAAQYCAAFGRVDDAFALLYGFYLGEGAWARTAPPQDRSADLGTRVLFQPLMASLWSDQRFPELTRRIGLQDYWRSTGTKPDYQMRA